MCGGWKYRFGGGWFPCGLHDSCWPPGVVDLVLASVSLEVIDSVSSLSESSVRDSCRYLFCVRGDFWEGGRESLELVVPL